MLSVALEYDYHTGDPELDTTAFEVRRLRRQADELAAAATARTSQAATQLAARGLSVRDIATLLGDQPPACLTAHRQGQLSDRGAP
ncbi:MAG TPA: hypothetical protein VE733_01480 [Streptosporangiaceae bacterium]|jgi:hypothetical protein|nr:hypothetical protein [Streptosporangiaceae bacterium]